MARTPKKGLDYFPHDCQQDLEMEYIESIFGLTGYAVYFKLLEIIYKHDGYYVEWIEKNESIFCKKIGLERDRFKVILDKLIEVEYFCDSLYQKHSILTSNGIQKRYLEATKKRKSVLLLKKYICSDISEKEEVKEIKGELKTIKGELTGKKGELNPQRKGKERKVQKNKKKKNTSFLAKFENFEEIDDWDLFFEENYILFDTKEKIISNDCYHWLQYLLKYQDHFVVGQKKRMTNSGILTSEDKEIKDQQFRDAILITFFEFYQGAQNWDDMEDLTSHIQRYFEKSGVIKTLKSKNNGTESTNNSERKSEITDWDTTE